MQVTGQKGITSSITFHSHGGKLSSDGLRDEDKQKIVNGAEPHFWFFPTKQSTVEPDNVGDESVTGQVPAMRLTPSSPLFACSRCSSSFIRHSNFLQHIDKGQHTIIPEKVSQYDFALGLCKRMVEEVQQGVGIDLLVESFKEYQQAADHPKPIGWALRTTKKVGKYNQKAKDMVTALFDEYYNDAKKLFRISESLFFNDQYLR